MEFWTAGLRALRWVRIRIDCGKAQKKSGTTEARALAATSAADATAFCEVSGCAWQTELATSVVAAGVASLSPASATIFEDVP